ncbi:hypothetical protein PRIPAC_78927, partial [Pristionchus pacificus]|uniref:G protein-coupled receptor n=1 Tax=Pristionchus pacificus TaxID=54126 RepID=A0A2A6C3C1_PRIPA
PEIGIVDDKYTGYSILLLYGCVIECFSIIAHFFVDGRIFVSSSSVVIISYGPCLSVADVSCAIATGFLNLNMIQSGSITALTRILQKKDNFYGWRLRFIIWILYFPFPFHIAYFIQTVTPRVLCGYSDVTMLTPAIVIGYMILYSLCVYSYIFIARSKLHSLLDEQKEFMNHLTRTTHVSLARVSNTIFLNIHLINVQALTIHAFLPLFLTTGMAVMATVQDLFHIHSASIEGLVYDVRTKRNLCAYICFYHRKNYKKIP